MLKFYKVSFMIFVELQISCRVPITLTKTKGGWGGLCERSFRDQFSSSYNFTIALTEVNFFGGPDDGLNIEIAGSACLKTPIILKF